MHHFLYSTDISSRKCFTFWNAMKQEGKLSLVDSIDKEINNHEEVGHWWIVHHNTLTNMERPMKEIWYFKRKQKPDGHLLKHKYWLCDRGGMQQWGGSYWETYSPVVNMISIRLILAISKIYNLDSKDIDFALASPQTYL